MASDIDPLQIVDDLMNALAGTPDNQLLAQLKNTQPLPDEDDDSWNSDQFWIDVAYPFDALSRVGVHPIIGG